MLYDWFLKVDDIFFIGLGIITFSLISSIVSYIKYSKCNKTNIYKFFIGLVTVLFSLTENFINNLCIIKAIKLICVITVFLLIFLLIRRLIKEEN